MEAATAARDWCVYLLRCADGSLYCGVTNDFPARLQAHRAGRGARYTRGRGPLRLAVKTRPVLSRGEALSLERAIKRCPRGDKLAALREAGAGLVAGVSASSSSRPNRTRRTRV